MNKDGFSSLHQCCSSLAAEGFTLYRHGLHPCFIHRQLMADSAEIDELEREALGVNSRNNSVVTRGFRRVSHTKLERLHKPFHPGSAFYMQQSDPVRSGLSSLMDNRFKLRIEGLVSMGLKISRSSC